MQGFTKAAVVNPCDDPPTDPSLLIAPADALELLALLRDKVGSAVFLDMDKLRLAPAEAAERLLGGAAARDLLVVFVCDHHIPLLGPKAWSSALETGRRLSEAGATVAYVGKPAKAAAEGSGGKGAHPDSTWISDEDPEPVLAGAVSAAASGLRGRAAFAAASRVPVGPDALPRPLPSDGDGYIDVRTLLTSRGCPRRCAFCSVPGYRGRWRGLSAASAAEAILDLSRSGAEKILLLDDDALASKERTKELCAILAASKHASALGCLAHASSIDEDSAARLAGAGFAWIHIGVESGDDRVLRRARKGLTVEKALAAVAAAKSAGLRVRTSWILDLPGTDEEALERTVDAVLEAQSHEVRLHHLARRFGSDWSTGRADEQIHSPTPAAREGADAADPSGWGHPRVDPAALAAAAERISGALATRGWLTPESLSEFGAPIYSSDAPKIVSKIPIRYGIGWTSFSGIAGPSSGRMASVSEACKAGGGTP